MRHGMDIGNSDSPVTLAATSAVRRTRHHAPLCVCWNYFSQHLARSIADLAHVPSSKASLRWDALTPDEQDRIEAVIHTMAEAREERAA